MHPQSSYRGVASAHRSPTTRSVTLSLGEPSRIRNLGASLHPTRTANIPDSSYEPELPSSGDLNAAYVADMLSKVNRIGDVVPETEYEGLINSES